MKKSIYIAIGLIVLVTILIACSEKKQIANPASEYCIKSGGKLRIIDEPNGQYGICTLPDGKECEEWAYFRKECP